jgi:hypothetical protein
LVSQQVQKDQASFVADAGGHGMTLSAKTRQPMPWPLLNSNRLLFSDASLDREAAGFSLCRKLGVSLPV